MGLMCRPERRRLYQHWLNTLASWWGSDIDGLIQELSQAQGELQKLYDRAALQVSLSNMMACDGRSECAILLCEVGSDLCRCMCWDPATTLWVNAERSAAPYN
jgi:hypothetical protein